VFRISVPKLPRAGANACTDPRRAFNNHAETGALEQREPGKNHVRKAIATAILAVLFGSSMQAALGRVSISDMKVFVTTETVGENEFADSDQQQRLDSVKDVKKHLANSVQLVDSEKDADIVLKVLPTSPDTAYVLLAAGDYNATFIGSTVPPLLFGKWLTAGNDAVNQIKKWIKQNHDKLIARRSKQSS